jgi:hypothetical protein
MAYTQLVEPDLSVHDNPGWCLDMIEKCFGTPRFHPSATSAWLDTQYKHYERDMPNVAVPVWFSWIGDLGDGQGRIDWGHVVAWIPSEGKFLSSPKNWNEGDTSDWYDNLEEVERWLGASYFGWSEDLNGMQIVSGSSEPAVPLAGNQSTCSQTLKLETSETSTAGFMVRTVAVTTFGSRVSLVTGSGQEPLRIPRQTASTT